MDKLVAGNYAPEEAKELLKDLGEKCGWGVSPDGFVLDYELAEMINGLKREAMELREAMLEEEDETKEEEMFEKASHCHLFPKRHSPLQQVFTHPLSLHCSERFRRGDCVACRGSSSCHGLLQHWM